jgi:hypothetical protein
LSYRGPRALSAHEAPRRLLRLCLLGIAILVLVILIPVGFILGYAWFNPDFRDGL